MPLNAPLSAYSANMRATSIVRMNASQKLKKTASPSNAGERSRMYWMSRSTACVLKCACTLNWVYCDAGEGLDVLDESLQHAKTSGSADGQQGRCMVREKFPK